MSEGATAVISNVTRVSDSQDVPTFFCAMLDYNDDSIEFIYVDITYFGG